MPDDNAIDLVKMGTHAATGVGGAGVVAAFMRWFAGKEAQEVATRLALIEQTLRDLVKSSEKHDTLAERMALLERDVTALHERLDSNKRRRSR